MSSVCVPLVYLNISSSENFITRKVLNWGWGAPSQWLIWLLALFHLALEVILHNHHGCSPESNFLSVRLYQPSCLKWNNFRLRLVLECLIVTFQCFLKIVVTLPPQDQGTRVWQTQFTWTSSFQNSGVCICPSVLANEFIFLCAWILASVTYSFSSSHFHFLYLSLWFS